MPDDPLAQFHETPAQANEAPPAASARLYEAFSAQDKVVALDIHRAAAPSHCPSYAYLIDMAYGRRFYTGFTLFFTFMTVKVRGENLKQIVDALRLRKCAYIQEFHPDDFDEPAPGTPLIRTIEIVMSSLHEAIAQSETGTPD